VEALLSAMYRHRVYARLLFASLQTSHENVLIRNETLYESFPVYPLRA
jgi:hypothetical protein